MRTSLFSISSRAIARTAAAIAVAGTVTVSGAVSNAPAAHASSQYECRSFAGCSSLGYGNAGYQNEYQYSHWNMDAGHACTNYVAYRAVRAGARATLAVHMWDARNWASYAPANGFTVDHTARPGSVAWWGTGTLGHVAWVERVEGNRILVSEDNSGGDFDWRWIDIADVPAFIHVAPEGPATPPAPVPNTAADKRIGVVYANGGFIVKEGPTNAMWTTLTMSAAQVSMDGNRIGMVTKSGEAYVKEGVSGTWVKVSDDAKKIDVDGNRIGVLRTNGVVSVKEGSVSAGWVPETDHVTDFTLEGDRIGILSENGHVYVKEGSLSAGWNDVAYGARELDMAGKRIGFVGTDGTVLVKEGPLNAMWVTETGNAKQLSLSGDRIGVLFTDGGVAVKEGSLSAGWNTIAYGAKQLDMARDRVGIINTSGDVMIKEGPLNAMWATVTAGDQLELS